MERSVRGGSLAVRAVQLGRPPPRQRQGGPQAWQSKVGQSRVTNDYCTPHT